MAVLPPARVIFVKSLFVLLIYLSWPWPVNSSRILVVFPVPGRSHYILGNTLARGLAEKGHDVTMVSSFEEKNPPKNGSYRNILLTGLMESMLERRNASGMNMFDMADGNPFLSIIFTTVMLSEMTELTLAHENVQQLMKSGEKFDAVIVEQFVNDGQKALAAHFDAPLILLSSVRANNWLNALVGNPSPPSYIPDLFVGYSSHMTFYERLINTVLIAFSQTFYHFYFYPSQNRVVQKYIPGSPDLYQSLYNSSIVLLNSHPSINQAVPQVPNMIDIGGYHVTPPKKLPRDIQEFLDNAKDGAVYFSLGSNLKSSELPPEKRDAILKVFSRLKQKVLWKWEDDNLEGKPINVKLGKWLPQQEILAHPNVKLFITHGGFLSTIETTYHGIPVLAIPIFGDQQLNARIAVDNGIGLTLLYKDLTEDTFEKALKELLNNSKYFKTAKTRAKIFHDRQVTPMETAIYWVEYVIRYRGAPHLRVAGLDLPLYKYLLLDVIAFLLLISLVFLYVNFVLLRHICRRFCSSRAKASNQKKIKKN